MGEGEIIINGSDSKDNSVSDEQTTFSSTKLIGWWQISELRTVKKNNYIDDMATYGFTIYERV